MINSFDLSVFQIKIIAPIVIFSPFWMSDLDGDLRLNRTLRRLSNIFPFETSHFHRNINEIEHVKPSLFPSSKTRSRFLLVPISWIPYYKNLQSHLKLRTKYQNPFLVRGYKHCLFSRPERWSSLRLWLTDQKVFSDGNDRQIFFEFAPRYRT